MQTLPRFARFAAKNRRARKCSPDVGIGITATLLSLLLPIITSSAAEPGTREDEGRYRLIVSVTSADRHEPIEGATVTTVFHYSSNEQETALKQTGTTDGAGNAYLIYDFSGDRWEPYHRFDVTITHPDFGDAFRPVPIRKNMPSGDIAIPVSLNRKLDTGKVAKVVIVKVVRQDDHLPLTDTHVVLKGVTKSAAFYDATTDQDGKAMISVSEGDDYDVTVSHTGFKETNIKLTIKGYDDQKEYPLEVELPKRSGPPTTRQAEVSVKTRNTKGGELPVSGALVKLSAGHSSITGTTDSSGKVLLQHEGTIGDTGTVQVSADDYKAGSDSFIVGATTTWWGRLVDEVRGKYAIPTDKITIWLEAAPEDAIAAESATATPTPESNALAGNTSSSVTSAPEPTATTAEAPLTQSGEVTVPNLATLGTVGEMKAALDQLGLTGAFVSAADRPPSKEKEFKFASQDPAPATKVARGTTVTISIYPKYEEAGSDGEDEPFGNPFVDPTDQLINWLTDNKTIDILGGGDAGPGPDVNGSGSKRDANPTGSVSENKESDQVIVPNFAVFDDVSEMKAVLSHAGLTGAFVVSSKKPLSKDKEFKFAGQDPAPDTKVARGTTVTISIYPQYGEKVIVPDLSVFDNVSEMKAVLSHAGLTGAFVAASDKPPSKDKEFKLAGQDPAPDSQVDPGSTVTVSIYQKFGEEAKGQVPNVVGLTLDQARDGLAAAGLSISGVSVIDKPPSSEQANRIADQQPAAGTSIPADGLVSLKQYGRLRTAAPPPEKEAPESPNLPEPSGEASDLIGTWEGTSTLLVHTVHPELVGRTTAGMKVVIADVNGKPVVHSLPGRCEKQNYENGRITCETEYGDQESTTVERAILQLSGGNLVGEYRIESRYPGDSRRNFTSVSRYDLHRVSR